MKTFTLTLSLIILAGCSSMNNPAAQAHKPQARLTTTPTVAVLGDDQILGLVNYVSNPMWSCTTCAQGQTSAQVLAEVPAVIARHPDIVVILTGAWDEIDNPQQAHAEPTVANVANMCAQFKTAGITPLVFELPDS